MEHRWIARRGILAVALLAGLGACTDSPVDPEAQPAATTGTIEIETSGAGFRATDAFLTVSTGLAFSCGSTLDGAAYCWGENGSGQLGTGDFVPRTTPARVAGAPAAWSASVGLAHGCALTRLGDVYCWGENLSGQLGNGTFTSSPTAVRVQRPANVFFVALTAGAVHTCALALSGDAWCWGDNSVGQLGNGTGAGSAVPVRVQKPAGVRFLSVGSGDGAAHTCAVGVNGAAYCWGDNTYGQLGDGTTVGRTTPVRVQGAVARFAAASGSGLGHSCGISTAGEALCWGDNTTGQLGDGTTLGRTLPTRVASTRRFASVAGGWYHTCGATALSGALCWGDNSGGKLGDGTFDGQRLAPVAVVNSQLFGPVDPGAEHTCSRRLDGEAFCWGANFAGELGNGTLTRSAVPIQVADPSASASVAPSFNRAGEGRTPSAPALRTWSLSEK